MGVTLHQRPQYKHTEIQNIVNTHTNQIFVIVLAG